MGNEVYSNEDALQPCYRCGYLIVCDQGVQCSECGLVFGTNDVEVARKRLVAVGEASKRVRIWMIRWLCIWIVYMSGGLGALWFVDSQMPWSFVYFMVGTLTALIWGSIGLGWAVSRFAPEHQKQLIWLGWLETLPIVHLSWLSIAGFTTLGTVVSGVLYLLGVREADDLFFNLPGAVIFGYVLIALAVWAIGSFVVLFAWPAKLIEYFEEHEVVKSQPGVGLMWALGLATYLAACAVGFMGGVLGAGFIVNLVG